MNEPVRFTTPVGRLVMGSPWEGQTTDYYGDPLVYKKGPNAGEPYRKFFFALAIPKTAVGATELIAKIRSEAKRGFPELFDGDKCRDPNFAWKYLDGDLDVDGREGFAGCWILKFSSSYAPTVWSRGGRDKITDPDRFVRGDWGRACGSVKANGNDKKPGLFLNFYAPAALEFCGHGDPISSGPSADVVFAGEPEMPPEATASTTVEPPPPPPAADPPPLPPAKDYLDPETKYIYGSNSYTRDALVDKGWTHEQVDRLPKAK